MPILCIADPGISIFIQSFLHDFTKAIKRKGIEGNYFFVVFTVIRVIEINLREQLVLLYMHIVNK